MSQPMTTCKRTQSQEMTHTNREQKSIFQVTFFSTLVICCSIPGIAVGLLFSPAIGHDKSLLTQQWKSTHFLIRIVLCPDLNGPYVIEVSISCLE